MYLRHMDTNNKKSTRGFSLIEIIVAVGVFTVVAMLTVGSLLILTAAEKRVASVQINQDNIRFAVDLMSREIRTSNGADYSDECGTSCLTVRLADGNLVTYSLVGTRLMRQVEGLEAHAITGPDVSIEIFSVAVKSPDYSDNVQAHVTFAIKGVAQKNTPNETDLYVQTSITPLALNE